MFTSVPLGSSAPMAVSASGGGGRAEEGREGR